MKAHSDWVNALASDEGNETLCSGGREGVVKMWKWGGEKLSCIAGIHAHNGAVTSLCRLSSQYGRTFVSGGTDMSIKLWKHQS